MAINQVVLVGRLTREPECRTFNNGGKVANFGFAVSNRKKNAQTGQYEDAPMFIDCKAFNAGERSKTADLIEKYLHKGHQCAITGRLELEQWDDKQTGQKRSKHVILVNDVQFLEPKTDGQGGQRQQQQPARQQVPVDDGSDYPGGGPVGEDIPF